LSPQGEEREKGGDGGVNSSSFLLRVKTDAGVLHYSIPGFLHEAGGRKGGGGGKKKIGERGKQAMVP